MCDLSSAILYQNVQFIEECLDRFPINLNRPIKDDALHHQNNKYPLELAFITNNTNVIELLLRKGATLPLNIRYDGHMNDISDIFEDTYNEIRSENYSKLVDILITNVIPYESLVQMITLSICEDNDILFRLFIKFIEKVDCIKLFKKASICCANHLILTTLIQKCGKDNLDKLLRYSLESYNLFLLEIINEIYGEYINEKHMKYMMKNNYIEAVDLIINGNSSNFMSLFEDFIQILPQNTVLYRGTCQYRSIRGYWFSPSLECSYHYGVNGRDKDLEDDKSIIAKYRTVKDLRILNITPAFMNIIPRLNDPKVKELFLNTMKLCKDIRKVCRESIKKTDEQLSNFLCSKQIDGISYLNWIAEDEDGEYNWSDEYRICSPDTSLEIVNVWSSTDLYTDYAIVASQLE
jgi:hypothetical protein